MPLMMPGTTPPWDGLEYVCAMRHVCQSLQKETVFFNESGLINQLLLIFLHAFAELESESVMNHQFFYT